MSLIIAYPCHRSLIFFCFMYKGQYSDLP